MINLDQVRTLEWKVKQAVQLIVHLRRENDTLRGRLSETEVRLQELESLVEAFKSSQSELESGIRSALEELDHLDGSEPAPASVAAAEPEGATEPAAFELGAPAPAAEPSDLTFEEEFAALAAEEAAAQVPVPESVELEADRGPEDEGSEEKEPEQPGLGIF